MRNVWDTRQQQRQQRRRRKETAAAAAHTVFFMSSRSYLTGRWRSRSKSKVASTDISLPAARRWALVHLSLRGLSLALNILWHLDRQKPNVLQSLRTNWMPLPG